MARVAPRAGSRLHCRGVLHSTARLGAAEAGRGGNPAEPQQLDGAVIWKREGDGHHHDSTLPTPIDIDIDHHFLHSRTRVVVATTDVHRLVGAERSPQRRRPEPLERREPAAGGGLQRCRAPVGRQLLHARPRHATGPTAERHHSALLLRQPELTVFVEAFLSAARGRGAACRCRPKPGRRTGGGGPAGSDLRRAAPRRRRPPTPPRSEPRP